MGAQAGHYRLGRLAALQAEAHLVVDLQVEVPEALPAVHLDLRV